MTARDPNHPREQLSALLDGEIEGEERRRVEAHLGDCAECRRLLEALRTIARAASEEDVPPVPATLERRIAWSLRSASPEGAQGRARGRWVPFTAAASLAAAVLLMVVWVRSPEVRDPGRSLPAGIGSPDRPAPPEPFSERALPRGSDTAPVGEFPLPGGKSAEPASPAGAVLETAAPVEPTGEIRDRIERPAAKPVVAEESGMASRDSDGADEREEAIEVGKGSRRAPTEPAFAMSADLAKRADVPSACSSVWEFPSSAPIVWPQAGDTEALYQVVERFGGTVRLADEERGTFRIEISRSSWPDLLAALVAFEVEGLGGAPEPAPGAECVGILVTAAGREGAGP